MKMNPIQQLSFPVRAARYFKDPGVKTWRKLLAVVGVLYVVSPIDLIPDFLPFIGLLDDIGVLSAVAWFFVREINALKRLAGDETIDASPAAADGLPRDERGAPRF